MSWNIIEDTYLASWGLEPASPVSVVNRHAISSRPSSIPKEDASSTELSNTVFSHSHSSHCLFPLDGLDKKNI